MKILILMTYFNRPILVRNALRSIKNSNHSDWHLVFGDDNSPVPGEPIAREILHDSIDRITFVNTHMSLDDKLNQGIAFGRFANKAVASSNADVGIFLCDDDELCTNYLSELSNFFANNSSIMYCYSKIHLYNPLYQTSEGLWNVTGHYNKWDGPINPAGKCDVSQVAFRLDCCREFEVSFPETTKGHEPWIENVDAMFFQSLYELFGPANPTGLVAQYKGIHDYQLVWHKKKGREALAGYVREVNELGGKKF